MDTTYGVYPNYEGIPIVPSKHAQGELGTLDIDLLNVAEVLELGFDCQRNRRKENIIERCIEKDNKILRVVVALVEWGDNAFWRLIHVGKTDN